MCKILNIETATTNCSVCIAENGKVLVLKEYNSEGYSHSEKLHVFIKEALEEVSLSMSSLDAIAVSKGPGSYTGLRIGVSAAKGLCFSLDIPLISIPTLESMAHQAKAEKGTVLISLLDARRMEVYSCVFNDQYEEMRKTIAEIIDESSFLDYVDSEHVILLGSGAEKCKEMVKHPNFSFNTTAVPSSKEMAILSYEKFRADNFEDVAYFEPYYLKDFMLQKKKS